MANKNYTVGLDKKYLDLVDADLTPENQRFLNDYVAKKLRMIDNTIIANHLKKMDQEASHYKNLDNFEKQEIINSERWKNPLIGATIGGALGFGLTDVISGNPTTDGIFGALGLGVGAYQGKKYTDFKLKRQGLIK